MAKRKRTMSTTIATLHVNVCEEDTHGATCRTFRVGDVTCGDGVTVADYMRQAQCYVDVNHPGCWLAGWTLSVGLEAKK